MTRGHLTTLDCAWRLLFREVLIIASLWSRMISLHLLSPPGAHSALTYYAGMQTRRSLPLFWNLTPPSLRRYLIKITSFLRSLGERIFYPIEDMFCQRWLWALVLCLGVGDAQRDEVMRGKTTSGYLF